ncbi:oligosaccharide flippase family protein [Sphingomonas tabacisoli]|uniref:Oligosaccharide flippase family protein n=1 Tax=Sphingomonas tabacisoli TaxID=2249466 RepID=A0ABW4I5A2_9SPHN
MNEERQRTRLRLQRARLTIAANIASRGLAFLVVFASARIALPDLGPIRFGIWMAISSLLLLLTFLDFGVGNGLVAPIASAMAAGDKSKAAAVATRGLALSAGWGVVLGGGLAVASWLAPIGWLFKGASPPDLVEARSGLMTFALLMGASPALGAVGRILAGIQRGYLSYLTSAAGSIVTVLLLLTLGRSGNLGVAGYILITFGLVQISALAAGVFIWRQGLLRIDLLRGGSWQDYRPLLASGGLFFGLQIAAMFGWGLDQTFISAISGPAAVATYSVVTRIYMLVSQPLYIFNAPLWAANADALHSGDIDFVRSGLRKSLLITSAGALLGGLTMVAAGPWIWTAFTKGQLAFPATLMITFAIWTLVESTGNAFAMYLNGAHIVREQLTTMAAFVAIAVPLKILVLHWAGPALLPLVTAGAYVTSMLVAYGLVFRDRITQPLRGGGLA